MVSRLSVKVSDMRRLAYLALPLILAVIQPFLSGFQRVLVTEMMIWSVFAMAYNLLFGYVGLLSLGHAMFFGSGMYGVAFSFIYLEADAWSALAIALAGTAVFAAVIGFLSIRVRGVYFLIITLIFAMTFYVAAFSYPDISGGDQGLVIKVPPLVLGSLRLSILDPVVNYYFVFAFFTASYLILAKIVASPFGRVLEAVRENEERASLIGYNVQRYKLYAFIISGVLAGLAGALYTLAFRFAGPQLMGITVSINVLIWSLVGGLGTLLGPIVGTFLLIPITDYASSVMMSYLIIVGGILIVIVMVAPAGIVGTVKNMLPTTGKQGGAFHKRRKSAA